MQYLHKALIVFVITASICQAQPGTLWTKTFGGSYYDDGSCVQQTTDGGFIIAGTTEYNGVSNYDVYLIKTDSQGNEQWSQTFDDGNENVGSCIQQTSDGGFIIAAYTYYSMTDCDIFIIKTDSQGNEQWRQTFGGDHHEYARSVQQTSDGGFIIVGATFSFGPGFSNIYLIRMGSETGVDDVPSNIIPASTILHPAHPNPFNATTTIPFTLDRAGEVELNIYNVNGRLVNRLSEGRFSSGRHHVPWNAEGMSNGVYIVRLETLSAAGSRQHEARKVVLVK